MANPLFANAPVTQAAPMIQSLPSGSGLANAMMRYQAPQLQAPSMGIPLSTLMALAKNPATDNPANAFNPQNNQTNPFGGNTMAPTGAPSQAGAYGMPPQTGNGTADLSNGQPDPYAGNTMPPTQDAPSMGQQIGAWFQNGQTPPPGSPTPGMPGQAAAGWQGMLNTGMGANGLPLQAGALGGVSS